MNEYYKPKINKEKETITLVNDAELKKAKQQLDKENILYSVSGKIIKFKRSIDFKAAQKFIKENKMNEEIPLSTKIKRTNNLSDVDWQKAKKLKGFNVKDWKWDKNNNFMLE